MDGLVCRHIEAELMDELPVTDERAQRARRDLRRINAWMGNAGVLARRLRMLDGDTLTLADLGSGDGTLLLAVARRMAGRWRSVWATLVDRQHLLEAQTVQEFARYGWEVKAVEADVFAWAASAGSFDAVTANLFLHHFEGEALRELLGGVAKQCRMFVASEPPRIWPALRIARFLPLIGCGAVACHDAAASIRAGFRGRELSELWPQGWRLREGRVGFFGHAFCAWRA